jgi:Uma2 family endonuclease
MSTKVEATIDDLFKVKKKAELVNGEVVLLPLAGALPGLAADSIFYSLHNYVKKRGFGKAVSGNVAFIVSLSHRKSFSPDAAFFTGRAEAWKYYDGAPDFAVEVRNLEDYGDEAERRMAKKRAEYFAAGTKVVWDVDLLSEDIVRAYRLYAPEIPMIFRPGEIAEAEPAVPGWTMPVDDLFPEDYEAN